MVGGYVIDIIEEEEKTKLHIKDTHCKADYCFVNTTSEDGDKISLGDSIWWQCGKLYWTPMNSKQEKCGVDFDIPLKKIGYSYNLHH